MRQSLLLTVLVCLFMAVGVAQAESLVLCRASIKSNWNLADPTPGGFVTDQSTKSENDLRALAKLLDNCVSDHASRLTKAEIIRVYWESSLVTATLQSKVDLREQAVLLDAAAKDAQNLNETNRRYTNLATQYNELVASYNAVQNARQDDYKAVKEFVDNLASLPVYQKQPEQNLTAWQRFRKGAAEGMQNAAAQQRRTISCTSRTYNGITYTDCQ